MKNKKGFTLIELLAVIIIIALISLITIPFIVNTIEQSRKKAFENSVMITSKKIDNYLIKYDDYDDQNQDEITVKQLNKLVKHNFISGSYIIKDGQIEAYFITDGTYCAKGPIKKMKISKNCTKLDDTESEIDENKLIVTSTSNSISVTIQDGFAKDRESGIKEYRISLKNTNKSERITDEGTVNFNGLKTGTYTVVIEIENGNGIVKKIEKEISTKLLCTPTYTVRPSGYAQSKIVAISQANGCSGTLEYSLDEAKTWSTYTSAVSFSENGAIIARVTDGTNYVSGSSQTVSGIDRSRPTSASFTYETTTSSITVTASGIDNQSNITHYQFSKDNGNTWSNVQTSNTYSFSNLVTGIYPIKVRVINGTYSNVGSINENNYLDSEKQDIETVPPDKPTYTVSPNGWSQSKTVTINYHDTNNIYTHEYSLNEGETWETYTGELTFTTNETIIAKVSDTNGHYLLGATETISTIDTSAPTASVSLKEKTSKSITVTASGTDEESHIYGYQYSKDNGNTWSSITSNTEYTFDNLPTDTYTIKVRAINNTYTNNGLNNLSSKISTGITVPTVEITKPTYVVSPSGWSQSKTVTILYPEGYTNEYSTNAGKADEKWYPYTSTSALTFEENVNITARVSDGLNYVTGATETISTIDTSAPTVANVTKKSTTSKSITVTASGTDNESNIYGYQFSKDNGTTWSEVQTSNEYTFNNLVTGTYNIKSKVINNTYGNEGINEDNSLVSSVNNITTNTIPTPTYSVDKTGWQQSKTVTIDFHDNNTYTHEYSKDGGAWTKVTGSTQAVDFTANGTLLARITDGTNPPSSSATLGAKTTSTVVVNATCADGDSGITKIEYSNGGSWIDNGTNEHYTFTNLTAGTSYNFKVRCTNGSLLQATSEEISEQIGSASITYNPSRTPSTSTWARSVSVPVTYTITNVTTPTKYIKTSVAGTKLDIAAVPCGTSTNPGTCSGTLNANTAMIKDTWYKVDSNPTVTVGIDTASVTLTGVIHDGNAYLTSLTQTITNVDTSAPTAASVTKKSVTTKSITVTASGTDSQSGIAAYQFSKDNGTTWEPTTPQASNEYTFNNLTSGTYNIKSRVYNGTYVSGGTNTSNYRESSANAIETGTLCTPTYTVSPSGWAQSKSVTIALPSGCSGTLQYSLDSAKTFTNYTSTITFTENGSVIARVTDGINYIDGSSQTIDQIDTTAPTATAPTATSTASSITITNKQTDEEVGTLGTIEYGISTSQNGTYYWSTTKTKTSVNGTTLNPNTTYYVKTRVSDSLGNGPTTSNATTIKTKSIAIFDGNGGSNGTSIELVSGNALGQLPTSSRTGYTFDGWYTAASGGTKISSSTTIPAGSTTYYAHWTINNYTLTYDFNKANNMRLWSKLYKDRFEIEYSDSTKINTIKMSGSDGWEILYIPIETISGKTYKLEFDYINPNGYTARDDYTGIGVQALNTISNSNNLSNSIETAYLSTTKNTNTQHIIFEFTAEKSTTYLAFNFGMAKDDTTTIILGNFKFTETKEYNSQLGSYPQIGLFDYKFSSWSTTTAGGTNINTSTRMPASDTTYYFQKTARNKDVYVSNNGNDTTGDGTESKPFATLTKAVDEVANEGNIILLSNLTLNSAINFYSKSMTIKSNDISSFTIYRGNSFTNDSLLDIYCDSAVTLSNITLNGNNVQSIWGAIFVNNASLIVNSKAKITNNKISNNQTNHEGAAIYLRNANMTLDGGEIVNNTVPNRGAAIFSLGDSNNINVITINSGIIASNEATNRGGGIFGEYSSIMINNGTISSNNAERGGGIYGLNSSITINDGTISNNKVSSYGGGVFGQNTTIKIAGGSINNNITTNTTNSTSQGGGVYCNSGSATMSNGGISSNSSYLGGGMFMYGCTLTISGGIISENTSSYTGGGIEIQNNSTLAFKDGNVISNRSQWGGGIYLKNSTGDFTAGIISSNSASTEGGGMYGENATINMKGTTVRDNISSKCDAISATYGTTTYSYSSGTISGTVCK